MHRSTEKLMQINIKYNRYIQLYTIYTTHCIFIVEAYNIKMSDKLLGI